ncbi:MAG TPA: MogA/MoaB family molybdenum cofactor biosynthesis protein [Anaerolineaceae bacterium]|nr:MogA/MoaB family molybdenum cofactor biosynthesis protein [Anaerolineaceae bacterium]
MIRFGILIISDRSFRGERDDLTAPALEQYITSSGYQVSQKQIVPDDSDAISTTLAAWADTNTADVILTSGGTGFTSRDITPEATLAVIDRIAPGISEAIRAFSLRITPHAMLSRAVSGIRKRTLIINLPGSPKGALESLEYVLPVLSHAVDLLQDSANAEKGHTIKG